MASCCPGGPTGPPAGWSYLEGGSHRGHESWSNRRQVTPHQQGPGLTWIRHLTERHDLVEQNSEGPDVRFDSELVAGDGLRGRPLHRELSSFSGLVHVFIFSLQRKAFTVRQALLLMFRLNSFRLLFFIQKSIHFIKK